MERHALRIAPAVVYVGPSVSRERVNTLLPGADLRPPVRRGDLHRDRQLHYALFVIIDGVFLQDEALPPREVIDILEDGAVVIGAASLGALRAAELWPAGMLGSGLIYRLYRRGVLVDEDEVAVLFDPHRPHPPLTAALVDVRWALRSAVRHGRLTAPAAGSLLEQARSLPFAERTWRHCSCAPLEPGLKERDALQALQAVRQLVGRDPSVLRRRRASRRPFPSQQAEREAGMDPWAGLDPHNDLEGLRRWLALHAGRSLPGDAGASELPAALLQRYRAYRDGLALVRARGTTGQSRHRRAAEATLARVHGAADWPSLRRHPPMARAELEQACDELTLLKALRDDLFASPGGADSLSQP
jgi:hypothetical protein